MNHYVMQPGDAAEKPTAEAAARDALTTLQGLAEDAAERMKEILDSEEVPDGMKIQVINMVLERVYGKPEEMLRIESGERSAAEAAERLRRAAERQGVGKNEEGRNPIPLSHSPTRKQERTTNNCMAL